MTKYETPITDLNFPQAEKCALEIHRRAARKRLQSRLIRTVSSYTMALTFIIAVYGIMRRIGFTSYLFGEYEGLPWLNSIWEAVFGHVFDVSGLWYVRYPLVALEAILIPAAISGILALITMNRKVIEPTLFKDDPRSRAIELRDIITCREGFARPVVICSAICTVAFIAFAAVESLLADGSRGKALVMIESAAAPVNYLIGIAATVAVSAIYATLSSLVSWFIYRDNGKAAVRMMSDLTDFIERKPAQSAQPEDQGPTEQTQK